MITKKNPLFFIVLFCAVTLASYCYGQNNTGDSICNELEGGTPGLYGLCLAACESRDLEFNEHDSETLDSMMNLYNKISQPSDPDLPCAKRSLSSAASCPLLTQEELDAMLDCVIDGTQHVRFYDLPDMGVTSVKFIQKNEGKGPSPSGVVGFSIWTNAMSAIAATGFEFIKPLEGCPDVPMERAINLLYLESVPPGASETKPISNSSEERQIRV